MGAGSKVLGVATLGVGAYVVIDRLISGRWFWETSVPTRQQIQTQMQTQNFVRLQVQQQLAAQERARLQRERAEQVSGRYGGQGWTGQPANANYGLARY